MTIQKPKCENHGSASQTYQRSHARRALLLPFVAFLCACAEGNAENDATDLGASDDLSTCILKTMELDEGRWEYVGTIARLDGGVRTYETTSVHFANGDGTWASKSFGGDVGGTEEAAEIGIVTLEGNSIVPIIDGVADVDAAIEVVSCKGPDPEGRYEVQKTYKLPIEDGGFDYVTNISWYGQSGSYFAEDHRNADGRVVARRSGVYMPASE
ncbi:MAG: hypothetical protein AAF127_15930 [Pseudomonadota bacterium]